MERLFLDANVLFSAAYKKTRLRQFWTLSNVALFSSFYAVTEAESNLARERPEAVEELKRLLEKVTLVFEAETPELPPNITLEAKDRPILLAAISAKATHLITGDFKHFGHLFGKNVEGVLILTPTQYLSQEFN
jgi:predicted nucleic acid-binding protein